MPNEDQKIDIATELSERATNYVDGASTWEDLAHWLTPLLIDIESQADEETVDLAYSIHLLISEVSEGARTEDVARAHIRRLIGPTRETIYSNRELITTYGAESAITTALYGKDGGSFHVSLHTDAGLAAAT
jgi:hypothetical protein